MRLGGEVHPPMNESIARATGRGYSIIQKTSKLSVRWFHVTGTLMEVGYTTGLAA